MILIADHNARVCETIRTMLAESGQEFIECSDGEEAVKLYAGYCGRTDHDAVAAR